MDRYLAQFRDRTQHEFRTDCGFRAGQLHMAIRYVRVVVDTLADVAEGKILDRETRACVFRHPR